jgi:uncharacterized protein (TIGR02145 family)
MKRIRIYTLVVGIVLLLNNSISAQKEVKIGNQTWMGENLNVNKFRNGNVIQQAQTAEQWEKAGFAKQPAWCYYEMDSKNGKIYGKLYNRFALYDPRGLAPKGWRLPSDKDWELLTAELGGAEVAGAKLKSATAWVEDNNLEDTYGFNALPGGWRDVGFGGLEDSCTWWSKNSETLEDDTRYYNLSKGIDNLMNYSTSWIMGYFVRCVKE